MKRTQCRAWACKAWAEVEEEACPEAWMSVRRPRNVRADSFLQMASMMAQMGGGAGGMGGMMGGMGTLFDPLKPPDSSCAILGGENPDMEKLMASLGGMGGAGGPPGGDAVSSGGSRGLRRLIRVPGRGGRLG
jgi:hypothetical protein